MMENSWAVSNDKLSVVTPDKVTVPMEKPVELLLDLGNCAIILLTENSNMNVLAMNNSGHILWRIQEHPWATAWYTSAWPEGESLVLYNAAGFALTVDPASGKFISEKQMH